jgi:hypothetical protein
MRSGKIQEQFRPRPLSGLLMLANIREQDRIRPGGFTMKRMRVVSISGFVLLAILLVPHFSGAAGPSLSALQGSYSETGQGSFAACLLSTGVEVPCTTSGASAHAFGLAETGQVSIGPSGSACTTITAVGSDLPPDAFPPLMVVVHEVLTVTGYDPITGTGDIASKAYTGGHCNGVSFDSTGATLYNSFKYHFAVTDKGNRWDLIVTSWTDPEGGIGSFLVTDTLLRQSAQGNSRE